MKTFHRVALAAPVIFLSLAACTGSVTGSPVPSGSIGSTESPLSGTPQAGERAPRVTSPVQPEPFLATPCRAISPDLLPMLGLNNQGADISSPAGSGCQWGSDADWRINVSVMLVTASTGGLSDLYAQYADHPEAFAYFEPTSIDGYPALHADTTDRRGDGVCLFRVGVTDELYAQILVDVGAHGNGACDLANRVGEALVTTLKNGA